MQTKDSALQKDLPRTKDVLYTTFFLKTALHLNFKDYIVQLNKYIIVNISGG